MILAFEGSSTATTSCPKNYTILACAEQTLHLATLKQAINPSKSVSFLVMIRWSSMELSFLRQRTSGVGWPVMRIRQSMARFSRVIRGPPWLLSMHGAARRKQNVITKYITHARSSENIANSEAFLYRIKLSKNLLFLNWRVWRWAKKSFKKILLTILLLILNKISITNILLFNYCNPSITCDIYGVLWS